MDEQVVGRDGFLFGAESTYSVPSGSITRYALGLGYAAPSYTVTLFVLFFVRRWSLGSSS